MTGPLAGVRVLDPADVEQLLTRVGHADLLVEGLRPGVAERLGVGPDQCLRRRARLVYGRMTVWGQDGPYAGTAGHDITYLSTAVPCTPSATPADGPRFRSTSPATSRAR